MQVTVERASDGRPPAFIIIGGLTLSTFGFMVYYLFPRALLELNLPLLMYIFFGLLIGMLLGLALLSLNFEKVESIRYAPFQSFLRFPPIPYLPIFTPSTYNASLPSLPFLPPLYA